MDSIDKSNGKIYNFFSYQRAKTMINEPTKLKQRYLFKQRQYEITKDGVEVYETSLGNTNKYKVTFENIPEEPIEISNSSRLLFGVTIFLLGLSALTGILEMVGLDVEKGTPFIWGGFGVISLSGYIISREHFLIYGVRHDLARLVLYKNKPTKDKLKQFISTVQNKKRDYLRQNYLMAKNVGASADEIHKLMWLREQLAISDDEFERLKKDVIEKAKWGHVQPPSFN